MARAPAVLCAELENLLRVLGHNAYDLCRGPGACEGGGSFLAGGWLASSEASLKPVLNILSECD
jgi:hypothetical protein